MTQPPLLAVVQRWCKEGNNALSQLIHTFGVVLVQKISGCLNQPPRPRLSKEREMSKLQTRAKARDYIVAADFSPRCT